MSAAGRRGAQSISDVAKNPRWEFKVGQRQTRDFPGHLCNLAFNQFTSVHYRDGDQVRGHGAMASWLDHTVTPTSSDGVTNATRPKQRSLGGVLRRHRRRRRRRRSSDDDVERSGFCRHMDTRDIKFGKKWEHRQAESVSQSSVGRSVRQSESVKYATRPKCDIENWDPLRPTNQQRRGRSVHIISR